jgi:hypothetical protein
MKIPLLKRFSIFLSLNLNGFEDYKIKIKGLNDINVRNFMCKTPDPETGFGSLTAVDVTLVEAAQAKLAAKSGIIADKRDSKESTIKGDEEEDEHKEVFTLGRMNTQSQTQVNRYYLEE